LALSRKKKEQLVQEYGERLARAQVAIWCNHHGLTVAQASDLRRQVRAADAESVVIKNTLMRMALERAKMPPDPEIMGGPCMVTFVYGEIAPAARAVTDFARNNQDMLSITGGLIEGELADVERILSLTTIPSRDVLLAQVVGGIQAPISGLVGTLAAVMRGLLTVLKARSGQLEGSTS
jgi:large subunit ribosomal protein L10